LKARYACKDVERRGPVERVLFLPCDPSPEWVTGAGRDGEIAITLTDPAHFGRFVVGARYRIDVQPDDVGAVKAWRERL
jgi:hypothetical protein